MRQLNEMALGAFDNREGAVEFGLVGVLTAREIIREGLRSEIEERVPEQRVAVAACFSSVLFVFHTLL